MEPDWSAGGIAGAAASGVKFSDCVSEVEIATDRSCVGGILGVCDTGNGIVTLESCVNRAPVRVQQTKEEWGSYDYHAGGLIGYAIEPKVSKSYNLADVEAVLPDAVGALGGLVGTVHGSGVITDCFGRGAVSCLPAVYGRYAGGLVGRGSVRFENCYSAGFVNAERWSAGAMVGCDEGSAAENCYYQNGTALATPESVVGKEAAEMRTAAFAAALGGNWSWRQEQNDGYPLPGAPQTWEQVGERVNRDASLWPKNIDGWYHIATAEQLAWLAYSANHGLFADRLSVVLDSDIDLAGLAYTGASEPGEELENCLNWTPIWRTELGPDGTVGEAPSLPELRFDGAGHTIKNMSIQGSTGEAAVGLFGAVRGGPVSDLTVEGRIVQEYTDAQLQAYSEGGDLIVVGGVAGSAYAAEQVALENCVSRVHITTNAPCVGGLVGWASNEIHSCRGEGTVESTLAPGKVTGAPVFVGGLCGALNGVLYTSGNTGGVTFTDGGWAAPACANVYGGGLAGGITGSASMLGCFNRGAVAAPVAGGLFGGVTEGNDCATIRCYVSGPVRTVAAGGAATATGRAYNDGSQGQSVWCQDDVLEDKDALAAQFSGADRVLPGPQMRSAGFAKTLTENEQDFLPDGYWHRAANVNGGYPVAWVCAVSWGDVGERIYHNKDGQRDRYELPLYGSSYGTAENPFEIGAPETLAWLAYVTNNDYETGALRSIEDKYFKLTADLDMAGLAYTGAGGAGAGLENALEWTPVLQNDYGSGAVPFHLDGAGHTIKNMAIRSSSFYQGGPVTDGAVGLFGCLGNVEIQDLTVEGRIDLGGEQSCMWAGGLAGKLEGSSPEEATLTGCTSRVELSLAGETRYAGGLVGQAKAQITSCRSEGAVSAAAGACHTGGLVAGMTGALDACGNTGAVKGAVAGGLFLGEGSCTVNDCFNTAPVTGTMCAGGLGVDMGEPSQVSNGYNAGGVRCDDPTAAFALKNNAGPEQLESGNLWCQDDVLEDKDALAAQAGGRTKPAPEMKTVPFAAALGSKWVQRDGENGGYPMPRPAGALSWKEIGARVDDEADPLHVYSLETGKLGEGSADKPYLIGAPETLAWLAYRHSEEGFVSGGFAFDDKTYKLTADLDLSGRAYAGENGRQSLEWLPIGMTSLFNGSEVVELGNCPSGWTLDGAGHTISNLLLSGQPGSLQGLFASALNMTVTDLTVQGSITAVFNAAAWDEYGKEAWEHLPKVGGFIGGAYGNCQFTRCVNRVEVQTNAPMAGGFVGGLDSFESSENATFVHCGNEARIAGLAAPLNWRDDAIFEYAGLGGLLGACHHLGDNAGAGGAYQSYNLGEVAAAEGYAAEVAAGVGGLFGTVMIAGIEQSFNTGAVTAPAQTGFAGGLVGRAYYYLTLLDSYSAAAVSGKTAAPLYNAGESPIRLTVTNSYYDGSLFPGYGEENGVTACATAGMKSAAAAFRLEGENYRQSPESHGYDRLWYCSPSVNGGYPVNWFAPGNWYDVGERVAWAKKLLVENTREEAEAYDPGGRLAAFYPRTAGRTQNEYWYEVGTPEALAALAYRSTTRGKDQFFNGASGIEEPDMFRVRLTNDIDLSGLVYTSAEGVGEALQNCLQWVPINTVCAPLGAQGGEAWNDQLSAYRPFSFQEARAWRLEGNGHTVKNLYMYNAPYLYQGLFGLGAGYGRDDDVQIANLTLEGSITAEYDAPDPWMWAWPDFSAENPLEVLPAVGGFAGSLKDCGVTNCVNRVKIQSRLAYTGGVCGAIAGDTTLSLCANQAPVSYTTAAHDVRALTEVGEQTVGVGGLCGFAKNGGKIVQSWNQGAVSVPEKSAVAQNDNIPLAGGVAGLLMQGSAMNDCYNRGPVTGALANGLAGGLLDAGILESYNAGPVAGSGLPQAGQEHFFGALFSSPTVPARSVKGSSTVETCYYDSDLFNNEEAANAAAGEGTPSEYMKSEDLWYALDHDRDIWSRWDGVNDGYPVPWGHDEIPDDDTGTGTWRAVGKELAENPSAFAAHGPTLAEGGATYEVGTPQALAWFAYMVNTDPTAYAGKNVRLTADLELGGMAWDPIAGSAAAPYTGVFDGNGHAIMNMEAGDFYATARRTLRAALQKGTAPAAVEWPGQGLIGCMRGGAVKNLRLVEGELLQAYDAAGLLAGRAQGTAFENCALQGGSVGFAQNAGGLVGRAENCTFIGCTAEGTACSAGNMELLPTNISYDVLPVLQKWVAQQQESGGVDSATAEKWLENINSMSDYYEHFQVETGSAGGLVGVGAGPQRFERCGYRGEVGVQGMIGYAGGLLGSGQADFIDCYSAGLVHNVDGAAFGLGGGEKSAYRNCYTAAEIIIHSSGEIYPLGASAKAENSYYAADLLGSARPTGGGTGMAMAEMRATLAGLLNAGRFGAGSVWAEGGEELPAVFGASYATSWRQVAASMDKGALEGVSAPRRNAEGAYLLDSPEDLAWFAYRVSQGAANLHAALQADLDMTGVDYAAAGETLVWTPIGTDEEPFTGAFRGGGGHDSAHMVDHLLVEGNDYQGLFGSVRDAVLEYFGVGRNSVIRGNMWTAGVAGYAESSTLTGCWNEGAVTGSGSDYYKQVGGVVGYLGSGEGGAVMRQCFNLGPVTVDAGFGETYVGGLVGLAQGGDFPCVIQDCYNQGAVDGTNYVGGLAGGAYGEKMTVRSCYSTGAVTGTGTAVTAEAAVGRWQTNDADKARMGGLYALSGSAANMSNVTALSGSELEGFAVTAGLNDLADAGPRTGENRVWYATLGSDARANGKPGFAPISFGGQLDFAPAETAEGASVNLEGDGKNVLVYMEPMGEDFAAAPDGQQLLKAADVAGAFNTSGTTAANEGAGFKLGTADLAGYIRGNKVPGSELTLYTAAAYCREEPIWYALALKDSAETMHEYAVRVAPAAGKVVSVVLPVNVTDGSGITLYQTHTQDYSAEMSIQNKSAFPVSVRVTGVTPVALGSHNVTKLLQLTKGAVNTGAGGSLESGNVKLFQTNIAGSAAASYKYDLNNLGEAPADPVVLGAQAGGTQGGAWKFRYLMEHGPAYSGGEETFGYQIVYELKLSAADAAAGTGKA